MRRDLDVQDEIPVLKLDMTHRTTLHELLPRRGIPARALLSKHGRRVGLCRRRIIGLCGVVVGHHGDGGRIVDVDLAHLVTTLGVRVEVGLGAIVTGLVGSVVPVLLVFGLVGLLVLRSGSRTVPAGGGVYLTDTSASLGV